MKRLAASWGVTGTEGRPPCVRCRTIALLGVLVLSALLPGAAPEKPPQTAPSHESTSRHSFAEVEKWVQVFDDPKRDEWQKPEEVVRALDIRPGMMVADVGAGTGYFERHLSRAVGPAGLVLAVDTEAEMVRHLGKRAREEKTPNVVPVLAAPDDPFLPGGRLDRILIVDTYHHIDDRLDYFRRLKASLSPEGTVAVVDFHKKPLPVGPPPEHKLSREFVLEEMKEAGWHVVQEKTFLPYQYYLLFRPRKP